MRQLIWLAALTTALAACDGGAPESPSSAESAKSAAAATATPPKLIPRDIIFGNPDRTQARISPDGKHVSWLAPDDGVLNVWVAPIDDPANKKVVTNDTYRGINRHFWAPNSAYIYYIQDEGGDENFHVYSADIKTGEVVDLTPVGKGVRAQI